MAKRRKVAEKVPMRHKSAEVADAEWKMLATHFQDTPRPARRAMRTDAPAAPRTRTVALTPTLSTSHDIRRPGPALRLEQQRAVLRRLARVPVAYQLDTTPRPRRYPTTECPVCQQPYFRNDAPDAEDDVEGSVLRVPLVLCCGHEAHLGCLHSWFQCAHSRGLCPVCRAPAARQTDFVPAAQRFASSTPVPLTQPAIR